MNILDTTVSIYCNVFDRIGAEVNLMTFLKSVKYRDEVLALRTITNKDERTKSKLKLPAVTVSGVFSPTRCAENLVKHTGLICVDIDQKDNMHIVDPENLKMNLSGLPEIAYCALSASGKGLYAILPLAYPKRQLEQFLALQRTFSAVGITIDRNCKDVCRLRSYSFDENPYINTDATPFQGLLKPEYRPMQIQVARSTDDTTNMVANLCRQIVNRHIDLTGDYHSWFSLGASLANLGETGRAYFHAISRQNDGYSVTETDKKFTNLLKNRGPIGIGTFFATCKENGIMIRK